MPQQPLFIKYTWAWLHEVTGFSKEYLSRVATGKTPLTHSFIERVCFKLQESRAELFLPDSPHPQAQTVDDATHTSPKKLPQLPEALTLASLMDK